MTKRPPSNVAASVRSRLLNRCRATGEDFQLLLLRYAAERFLYRLGESAHRDRLVLKGAMLLVLWEASTYRPTRDLDFSGSGTNEAQDLVAYIRDICALRVQEDGLVFDIPSLTIGPIGDGTEQRGVRVRFLATLANARIPMQIDVGFGNALEPGPREVEYPTLLEMPAPVILAYPREAVVAEKLHAMVEHGERNSRLKDFYDLHLLAMEMSFDGARLTSAVRATFQQRRTPIEAALPVALTARFYGESTRAEQWRAYLTRNGLDQVTTDFEAIGEQLLGFLVPPWAALAAGEPLRSKWQAGGPWEGPS